MSIFTIIWSNALFREVVLLVASAVAAQFLISAPDLLSALDSAENFSDVWVSGKAWADAFLFAGVITVVKQAVAWAIRKAGGGLV